MLMARPSGRQDGGVRQVAQHVHPLVVEDLRLPAVGEEGEGDTAGRVRPAIGGADAAMAEGPRMRDGAEAAGYRPVAAQMRADAAMHGQVHVLVDAVAGEVAGDELD